MRRNQSGPLAPRPSPSFRGPERHPHAGGPTPAPGRAWVLTRGRGGDQPVAADRLCLGHILWTAGWVRPSPGRAKIARRGAE